MKGLLRWIRRPLLARRLHWIEAELVKYQEGLAFWRQEFPKRHDVMTAMNLGYCRARTDELQAEIAELRGKL